MDIFKKTSFWILSCVIAYSIGILLFWTIDNLFNRTADDISAFGSVLSAVGTFFAASVAVYLFNDWKEQHNKTILAGEAKLAFSLLHNERNILYEMKYLLKDKFDQNPSEFVNAYDSNLSPLPRKLIDMINTNMLKLSEFVFLIEGSKLYSDLNKYRESVTLLNKDIADWNSTFKTYNDVFENYNSLVSETLSLNFIILQDLKSYILYKDKTFN